MTSDAGMPVGSEDSDIASEVDSEGVSDNVSDGIPDGAPAGVPDAVPSLRLPSIPTISPDRNPCLENKCSRCCHDTEMLLTEADVQRLRLQHPRLDFVFTAKDGYLQLRTTDKAPAPDHTGRPCVFLDAAGRCTTWETQPEGCRLYPALWDDDMRRALPDKENCPYTDGFRLDDPVAKAVQALAFRLHKERDLRLRRRARGGR